MPALLHRVSRLFVIKTRFEAYLIIFALANGAMTRGAGYLTQHPGWLGWVLFAACSGAVFLGGASILDSVRRSAAGNPDAGSNAMRGEPTERTA